MLFEFMTPRGVVERLCFRDPLKVLCTREVSEVRALLQEAEEHTRQGRYVAGYLAYEAAHAFDPAMPKGKNPRMPLIWLGVFEGPSSLPEVQQVPDLLPLNWMAHTSEEHYLRDIQHIKHQIAEGNTYQVNYTLRLTAPFQGNAFHYYQKLVQAQQGAYSAYLDLGRFQILSASPELFFHWNRKTITTRPMKGTAPRGRYLEEDEAERYNLKTSVKNRAENLMIVDLIRNDLSRFAIPGTVRVSRLFEVEKYRTLWTMTSTVQADTPPDLTLDAVFEALFPCGSITGAPKISTMHIIDHLEPAPRQAYCGAIGYMTPQGEATFNVPIRTVVIDDELEQAEYGVGGGITWDSDPEDEYQETLTKTLLLTYQQPLFKLTETLHLHEGFYPLLKEHINRLVKSARYWEFPDDPQPWYDLLQQTAQLQTDQDWLVTLLLSRDGHCETQLQPYPTELEFTVAREPLDELSALDFHSTDRTLRTHLELLYHADGQLSQFNHGNLVVKLEDQMFTPPFEDRLYTCPILEKMLLAEEVTETPITLEWLSEHPDAGFYLASCDLLPARFKWNS